MANEWIHEPEFNRWYIKWTLLDFVRAGMAGLVVTTAIHVYRFLPDTLSPAASATFGFVIACITIIIIATILALKRKSPAILVESPLELFNGVLRFREGRLKQVASQEFRNQEVPLDGIEYIDCVFDGVTFVYNGTGKTAISGKSIIVAKADGKPNAQFKSENPLVGSIALIFQAMGFLREDAKRRIESVPLDRQ